MKKLSRIAALLAAAALLFGAAGCSGDDDDDPKSETVSVTGVSVSPDHVSVEEEQTATLTATVEPENATNKTVRWAITGEDGVVEITDKGDGTATVKGVKKGETKITVTTEDGEFKKEVSVTVYAKGELVEVESVSISADKTEIEVDGTAKITATIEPKNATDKNLTWSAKPEGLVEITENEDGTATVKGKAAGKVTITATASSGVKSDGLDIEVKAKAGTPEENPNPDEGDDPADPTVFVLEEASATISLGKTNIGTIAGNANAGGKAYISVATDDWNNPDKIGDFSDQFYSLNNNGSNKRSLTINVKKVAGFTVYVKNSTAGRTFTVKVGDGEAVMLTHPGTGVVSYTFNTGMEERVAIVLGGGNTNSNDTVYPGYIVLYSDEQNIPVETVEITGKPEAAVLLATGTIKLDATVSPERATNKVLEWTSDNENYATVDNTGLVTLKAAGTVTITAEAASGKKDTAEIVIQSEAVKVSGITVKDDKEQTSGTINAGDTLTLTAVISPDDASDKKVTWSSSDEDVATVADGVVVALKGGSTTIKATAVDGSGVMGEYVLTVVATETIKFFTDGYNADGQAKSATSSNEETITSSDISYKVSWDTSSNSMTERNDTTGGLTKKGHYLQSASNVTTNDTVAYTFTVTAKTNVKLSKLTFETGCGQTGNYNATASYKIGNEEAVSFGNESGKGFVYEGVFDDDVILQANANAEITILLNMNKETVWKSGLVDIVLSVVPTE